VLHAEMEAGSMVSGVASREISAMTADDLIAHSVESPSLACAARGTFLVVGHRRGHEQFRKDPTR
jgi:hypothetical protein